MRSYSRYLILVALMMLAGATVRAADVSSLLRQGNGLFARGKFDEALGVYQRAEVLRPDDLRIHYNIGNTLFRLNRHEEAISELTLAAVDKNPVRRANALYNIGNVQYRRNRLDEAINAYRLALIANPADLQAKQNLEFCLKKKREQEQQQNQQNQQQQQQQNEQQQQPQSQRSEMDRQQAERILEQIQNQERRTQRDARQEPPRRQVEKDW
ncbi:MAG: tetratricopeptide repeat protein [candidate division WOR-3 bacterium]